MADDLTDPEILETIIEQFTQDLRGGRHPAILDYQKRYPNLADEIEDLLSSVAMIEQLKSSSETRSDHQQRFDTVSQLTTIGNYEIIRELGRGGMGIVFEAVHESLGRRVAIKVMPTPLVNSEKHVERFRREAQAAARLHHTNIVSVFGVGEGDGYLYYVMDWVNGASLNEVIANLKKREGLSVSGEALAAGSCEKTSVTAPCSAIQPDSTIQPNGNPRLAPSGSHIPGMTTHFRWAARIAASIADALAYAHASNILHRDIKPANMILDHQGTPWITDFGLAKDSASDLNLTKTGDVIGTPQYLAPESLEGHYDQRSETYCLGLTLYELVTLEPAYSSGTTAEVIRAIATKSPTSPRKINPRVPLDLATIIDKSVSRDRNQRYQTATELRNDLLAFVEDRPISARRPSWMEATIRWSRSNPLPATLSAISATLLTLVAVSATIGYLSTTDALRKEAEKSEHLRLQQLATADARDEAERNFLQMKAQHDRAESNVTLTIEAFDEIFKQVIAQGAATTGELDIDGFRELSGIETSITKEDARFLNKLVTFYQEFATLNADNARLKTESAKAFRRVGNIYQLVGEMESAIAAYEKSIELYEAMFAANPESEEQLLTLVRTQNELSAASSKNGDLRAAHDWNHRSLDLLEDSPMSASDPDVRLELARTLSVLGFHLFRARSVGGINLLTDGRQRSANAMPGRPPNRNTSGFPTIDGRAGGNKQRPSDSISNRGQFPQRRMADAIRAGKRNLEKRNKQGIEQAIEILDGLIADSPDNDEYRSVRATCYCVLAAAKIESDRTGGYQTRDTAIQEFETLVNGQPGNPEYRYLLALACALGSRELHLEDPELLERSLDITESLVEQFPHLLDYHHLLASLKIRLASHHIQHKELEIAWQELRTAKSSIEQLLDHTPSDRSFMRTMMTLFEEMQNLARSLNTSGEKKKANEVQQAITQLRSKARSKITLRKKGN